MMKSDELVEVAKIGKVVGLNGHLKLHNLSDFSEQFKKNSTYSTNKNQSLIIQNYDKQKSVVKFIGIDSRDDAKTYTNAILYTTKEATRQNCKLKKNEYFWFDIIGCAVEEDGVKLGLVDSIERIGINDFLHVRSCDEYVKNGKEVSFLIPYVDRYIKKIDIDNKTIITIDAKYFLEK